MSAIDIERYIPEGYENRVGRSYLKSITGMTDRQIRRGIEDAVKIRGILIASFGGGYFRKRDDSDMPYIRAYISSEKSRLRSLRESVKCKESLIEAPKKKSDQIPGQISMFEEAAQ